MNAYRLHPQPGFNFGGLIIDNFAGGGGASTGIEMALGRPVDIAINHDPEAIAMHDVNHPHTKHFCESVWDIDPRTITGGRPVDLCWFSPDCKHFSKAKGGTPVSKKIRGLAWVALRYAATVRPRVIMLENVEEFVTWGPIGSDGRPCPDNKGRTFASFVNALRKHGYAVEWRELRASDYGAPTIRKRLFLVARCDGLPISWPAATHGDPNGAEVKAKQLKPWRTAGDIIDWSLPCPSIFERKRPLAENTMRRIARGLQRYVIDSPTPFLVKVNHGYDYFRGQSLDDPLQTITSILGTALVTPTLMHLGTAKGAGGKHELVASFLAKHYGGNYTGAGSGIDQPVHTVTATDHNALVTSHLLKLRNNCTGQDLREPIHTITTGGHFGEVRAFLIKYYGTGDGQTMQEPLHTVTTKDRYGLIMVKGEPYQIVDIGMRMLAPHELYAAQGFPADYIHDRTAGGKPLTIKAQVRMCGNSVCPPMAAALVRANMAEQQGLKEVA
ncbi:DNA (cytosine-5)-methyltransferase 1 [Halopseudomonas litoralis]|uniref:DNA (cytosine-5-)-methyltransferase n=1 Tax=Halopseudomonas litoralis TaxID=797277 RepID=A0A1H1NT05_9GAMM|nr:DNA cytosine methyltransferase [Halopseudomonas litoralis]SDS02073.1 DNA (cytosine-5)-methyltransferase 1 [Halopseudomonas litoralis]